MKPDTEAYLCGSVPVQNPLLEPCLHDKGTKLGQLSREVRRIGCHEGARWRDFGRRRFGLRGVPITALRGSTGDQAVRSYLHSTHGYGRRTTGVTRVVA